MLAALRASFVGFRCSRNFQPVAASNDRMDSCRKALLDSAGSVRNFMICKNLEGHFEGKAVSNEKRANSFCKDAALVALSELFLYATKGQNIEKSPAEPI